MAGAGERDATALADPHAVSLVGERIRRFDKLRTQMAHDGLTHLYNHSHFKEQLISQLAMASRRDTTLVLAMIDVDGFKGVNDTCGHPTGDRVLQSLAHMLKSRLRRSDIVGRYGGDEFGVIMPDTNLEGAHRALEDVRDHFGRLAHQCCDRGTFRVTFSCGLASFPDHAYEGALVRAADAALYEAKRAGKNRITRHKARPR